ncbi:MAG: hypothetical protein IPM92_10150 [Saprospiraceae bacterium]|nr:hypothetical protein [Saprospiraceae bacterium]
MNNLDKNLDKLMEEGWLHLQTKLDQQMPIPEKSKRKKNFLLWLLFAGFIFSGAFALNHLYPNLFKMETKESEQISIKKSLPVLANNEQALNEKSSKLYAPGKLELKEVTSQFINKQKYSGKKNQQTILPEKNTALDQSAPYADLKPNAPGVIIGDQNFENEPGYAKNAIIEFSHAIENLPVPICPVTNSSKSNSKPIYSSYNSLIKKQASKNWNIAAGSHLTYLASDQSFGGGLGINFSKKISSILSLSTDVSFTRYIRKEIESNDFNTLHKINKDLESFNLDHQGFIAYSRTGMQEWNINSSLHYHAHDALRFSGGIGYAYGLFQYEGVYLDPLTALPGSTFEKLKIQKHIFQLHAGIEYVFHKKWTLYSKTFFLESSGNFKTSPQIKNQWTLGVNYSL